MKILLVEDELITRQKLEKLLSTWQYEVISAADGIAAWNILREPDAPRLALVDWELPGMNGVEVCVRARSQLKLTPLYLILLTGHNSKANITQGLDAGADDYITKPFDTEELRARVQTGARIVRLQTELAERITELQAALADVKQLRGLLPICCYCKKIRDDKNYWHEVESYISRHTDATFTHGICPICREKAMKECEIAPDSGNT